MKCTNCEKEVSFAFYPRGERNYCNRACLNEARDKSHDSDEYINMAEDIEVAFEEWWEGLGLLPELPDEARRGAFEAGYREGTMVPQYDD